MQTVRISPPKGPVLLSLRWRNIAALFLTTSSPNIRESVRKANKHLIGGATAQGHLQLSLDIAEGAELVVSGTTAAFAAAEIKMSFHYTDGVIAEREAKTTRARPFDTLQVRIVFAPRHVASGKSRSSPNAGDDRIRESPVATNPVSPVKPGRPRPRPSHVSHRRSGAHTAPPASEPPKSRPRPIAKPGPGPSALRPQPDAEVNGEYTVWYGTNRRPIDPRRPERGYSAERDTTSVHYGYCQVYIPASHKIGSTGSVWWRRLLAGTDDRVKVRLISEMAVADYWDAIAQTLSTLRERRHAVVFIHGFNVTFKNAAVRAAQIGFDLSIRGPMAFFSWPSQGRVQGYSADEATIEWSENAIRNFLVDFAERSGADAVHVIAHSMGNRGLLRAMDRIAQDAALQSRARFGQVILAAADVDADVFRELAGVYRRMAIRTTLYVSQRDRAVEASRWLHKFPRVGLMPPVHIVSGIDTVSVTHGDVTLLGHGYVAESRPVLMDMHQLITNGNPPHNRFGLREQQDENGGSYWIIGA